MIFYWLIIFFYSIIYIELKEIKIKKSIFFSHKEINNRNIVNNINYNLFIIINETKVNKIIIVEEIFKNNELISFFFLFSGSFIMLYGAYYYKLSLIIHFTLFLYNIIILIFVDINIFNYEYILLFSFISGLLVYIFLSTEDRESKRFKIQKIIYGGVLGCFLHKIIIYYINYYMNSFIINNDDIEKYNIIYYITFFLFILIFGVINYFIPDKWAFLPCSTISTSFYIINSLDCIIDIKTEEDETESFLTSIIIQVLIIFCSFFYQIYHKKYKDSEDPNIYVNEKDEKDEKYENDVIRNNSASISYTSKSYHSIDIKNSLELKDLYNTTITINDDDDDNDDDEDDINE